MKELALMGGPSSIVGHLDPAFEDAVTAAGADQPAAGCVLGSSR
jgi:hypothetical protein